MSCGSVDIWWTFTLSMSWWTTVSWQTTSDKIPPCHTGRQLLDGGIVASSSLGLTKKKRSYFSSLFPQVLGHAMCTLSGQALSCWLPWWQCFLGSTLWPGVRGVSAGNLHENTPREAETPRRCVHTGKGFPST